MIYRLDSLKSEIHGITGVPPNAQIILTLQGAQLKPDMALSAFGNDAGHQVCGSFGYDMLMKDIMTS